jgi:hypothetical protein
VFTELVKNFLHLISGREGLDEDSCPDCTLRHADMLLREDKDIVPKSCFQVMLHLREVEVWPNTASNEFVSVVEEVEAEVKDASRYRSVINRDPWLVQVPSTRSRSGSDTCLKDHQGNSPYQQNRWLVHQLVGLAANLKVDFPTNGIVEVKLPFEHVGKRGRVGVLCTNMLSFMTRDIR